MAAFLTVLIIGRKAPQSFVNITLSRAMSLAVALTLTMLLLIADR